ncbi:hypothetical protein RRF57_002791 [Xylaria bambusicola]|uniref:Uncharacterized protein n=1 Tax=Xylaria bambusicola TaxID=326684 RepID=A0AAN7UJ81_9PEZI
MDNRDMPQFYKDDNTDQVFYGYLNTSFPRRNLSATLYNTSGQTFGDDGLPSLTLIRQWGISPALRGVILPKIPTTLRSFQALSLPEL